MRIASRNVASSIGESGSRIEETNGIIHSIQGDVDSILEMRPVSPTGF